MAICNSTSRDARKRTVKTVHQQNIADPRKDCRSFVGATSSEP